jgi:hypothetical protein
MSTPLTGELVAVGVDPDDELEQPRALIQCTKEQIQAVERLPMLEQVVVIPAAEYGALRSQLKQAHDTISRYEEQWIDEHV